jgi:hypothetical protein
MFYFFYLSNKYVIKLSLKVVYFKTEHLHLSNRKRAKNLN